MTYIINDHSSTSTEVSSIEGLKDWIRGRATEYREFLNQTEYDHAFDPDDIGGFLYTSSTLDYKAAEGYRQTGRGSGPNYFGKLYTLATCAWKKRATHDWKGGWNFDQHFTQVDDEKDLFLPDYPVIIINTVSKSSNGHRRGQWVPSIAFVTHAFRTVEGYASHLISNYSGRTVSHRLTRQDTDSRPKMAIQHGDCHADYSANVGGPPEGHSHHEGFISVCDSNGTREEEEHKDNWSNHLKALSMDGYYLVFEDSIFEKAKGGDRGGAKIKHWNLEEYITEVEV